MYGIVVGQELVRPELVMGHSFWIQGMEGGTQEDEGYIISEYARYVYR